VAHVWPCQACLGMDHNGVSRVQCNVLQGHDHCRVWHAVGRHKGPMHYVEKIQQTHEEEGRGEAKLQRLCSLESNLSKTT
jgi:hypothetical protein